MTIKSAHLLQDLIENTQTNRSQAEELISLSIEELNWKAEKKSWSILECLEHLNLYSNFYLPEISERIENSNKISSVNFTSGIVGDYFAKSMLPRKKLNKMNTFKDKNPLGSKLDKKTITRFISDQTQLLDLLNKSRNIDLNKTKTAISISKLLKLKLGDTFRIVVYHNQRHIAQANKVLGTILEKND
ncbi:DinB family protein [Flavobacterium ardleyense]|uniref:DinB family protein n=1 Tax=Flavobacterium ardleyense TaxID=2038737 RepID=A0ABW5Z4A4_9FLAO